LSPAIDPEHMYPFCFDCLQYTTLATRLISHFVVMSWLEGALSNLTILIFLKYACVMASAKLDIAKYPLCPKIEDATRCV